MGFVICNFGLKLQNGFIRSNRPVFKMTSFSIRHSTFDIRHFFKHLLLGFVLLIAADAPAETLEPARFPSLMSSIRITAPLHFCGEPVPLNRREVKERMEKELLLTLGDRPQIILWIKRSHRYLPLMEDMLAASRMPKDLKYISVIESALRPHAGSRKGAIGFWQFMPETAKIHGLRVDDRFDERRNVYAATEAAIRYFKSLHSRFGSWTLAAAAFNMGEEGLASEILAQGTDDYYRLYLPLETQRYLLRILSAKLILSDPERYGFSISQGDLYPPLQYDRIEVELPKEIPILMVAESADTHFKTIKDLNPEIRGHYLPPGIHTLFVPKGSSKQFHARFKKRLQNWQADMGKRIYVVQEGDNLSAIADRFGVPLPALLIWNRLDPTRPIHPGDRLVIAPDRPDPNRKKQ